MTLDLVEIRSYLESSSIKKRKNFIENYDFEDNYRDFYYVYLKENLPLPTKDTWYLIALIELAQDFGFFDHEIRTLLWELYEAKKNAVYLKLTILDYLADFPLNESEKSITIQQFETFAKRTRNDLLKNQLFCNLLHLDPENETYLNRLLEQILKTQDCRSLIRVLNFFKEYEILSAFVEKIRFSIQNHELAKYESVKSALDNFEKK